MNYDFFELGLYGKPNRFIQTSKLDEGLRPSLGTQMKLERSKKLWQVVLISPPDNPADQKVTYFLKPIGGRNR